MRHSFRLCSREPKEVPMRIPSPERSDSRFAASLGRATRTLSRCLVCGFRELRTDEVVERGWLLLAECPRCEHRFTQALPGPAELAPAARAPERAAPARPGAAAAA